MHNASWWPVRERERERECCGRESERVSGEEEKKKEKALCGGFAGEEEGEECGEEEKKKEKRECGSGGG